MPMVHVLHYVFNSAVNCYQKQTKSLTQMYVSCFRLLLVWHFVLFSVLMFCLRFLMFVFYFIAFTVITLGIC